MRVPQNFSWNPSNGELAHAGQKTLTHPLVWDKHPYLPVYNAHFFSLKSTFKFTMRIIHGFHCLVKKTKEDKNFAVIDV